MQRVGGNMTESRPEHLAPRCLYPQSVPLAPSNVRAHAPAQNTVTEGRRPSPVAVGRAVRRPLIHDAQCATTTSKTQDRVRMTSSVPNQGEMPGGTRHMWGSPYLHILEQRRSEEHTSELQSHSDLVCRLLLEKKKA